MNPIPMDGFSLWIFPLALALDLLLGDPRQLPHPIRWMGRAIETLEPRFRRTALPPSLGGGLMALVLITGTWLISWTLLFCAQRLHPHLGWTLAVLMLFYTLSIRSLAAAAGLVYQALIQGDIDAAKNNLAQVVGRDVQRLDQGGIARAAVETVAENLVDGIIAPLFYALVGGPALAMTYKMVNTLDSMIGYQNDRYIDFGRWAAKIDDAANYLPARFSVPIIAATAHVLNRSGKPALATARQEGRRHHSPNAGFPEAAFAGALGVKLGGPNVYHGHLVDKLYLGEKFGPCRPIQIKRACDLMSGASVLWLSLCWAVQLILAGRC